MCGIAGFIGNKDGRRLNKMLDSINHRGKDERVTWFGEGVNLGMNRLAIVDLNKDIFPFKDGKSFLIYNGEIYNHLSLREELGQMGVRFKTNNDGEVILPLWKRFGMEAFSKIKGMFSIVIFDRDNSEVILVRDKMGIKPLYYAKTSTGLVFGSELKTILISDLIKNDLDHAALGEYLQRGFVLGNKTLIRGVNKLPAGCFLHYSIKKKRVRVKKYWTLKHTHNSNIDINESVNDLDKKLRESVKNRLMADVGVGCFLSGGVDSSLIAMIANQETRRKIKTFSISFPDFKKIDESKYATKVAKVINSDHLQVECRVDLVKNYIENIGEYVDDPICDTAMIPTNLLSCVARKKVKVVLTGEGADELFGGYRRYRKEIWASKMREFLKTDGNRQLAKRLLRGRWSGAFGSLSKHYSTQGIWNRDELSQLLSFEVQELKQHRLLSQYENEDPLRAMQLSDVNEYLPEQLLMKVDKMTMANNLEARVPFLDIDLVKFAFNLPSNFKLRNYKDKWILRKVAERYLPFNIAWRGKHGFYVPMGNWLRNELKDQVLESVNNLRIRSGIFNPKIYQSFVERFLRRDSDNQDKVWSMMVLTSWAKKYNIGL